MVIFREGDKLVLSKCGIAYFAVRASHLLDRGPATFGYYVNDCPGCIQLRNEGDWSSSGVWTESYFELQESSGPW